MTTLDWIILAYIAIAVFNGFRSGLIHMVGALVGTIFSVALAGRWYEGLGSWLGALVFTNDLVAKVAAFVLLLTMFNRLFGLGFMLVNKVVNIVKLIPGISGLNRLGGGVLGLLEGVLVLGLTLYVATKFDVGEGWTNGLAESKLLPLFTGIAQIVVPLLPGAIKSVQSVVNKSL